MSGLPAWWQGRSAREQRLLLVMAALALIVLGWLGLFRPLNGALEEAQLRHDAAVMAVAQRQATGTRTAPAPSAAAVLPIDSTISRTATEAGFTDAQIASQGPAQATVSIAAARPQAAFAWISGLERQGVSVETLRVQANSDQTLQLEIRFAARGG